MKGENIARRRPADDYDAAGWLAFYAANPGLRRSVGAEGDDAAGQGDGDGGAPGAGDGDGDSGAGPGGGEGSLLDLAKGDDADGQGGDQDAGGDASQQEGTEGGDGDGKGDDGTPRSLTFKERPDWLPENFYDKKTGTVNVEALAKSQQDLRKQVSMGGKDVPKDPTGYEFGVPDDMKDIEDRVLLKGENGEPDPIVDWFGKKAVEHEMPKAVAQDMYRDFVKLLGDITPEPINPQDEIKSLGPEGQNYINHLAKFHKHLNDLGVFNKETSAAFLAATTTASGVRMIQGLREYYGEKPIPGNTEIAATSDDADALRKEMSELLVKADKGDPSAEREFQRLQAKYEKHYGVNRG